MALSSKDTGSGPKKEKGQVNRHKLSLNHQGKRQNMYGSHFLPVVRV